MAHIVIGLEAFLFDVRSGSVWVRGACQLVTQRACRLPPFRPGAKRLPDEK